MFFGTTLSAALLFTGCAGPLSALDPAGPAAETISTIWWVMLAGAAAIFLLVLALLILAFRRRDRNNVSTKFWIVGGGLVFPSTVLVALLVYGLVVGERLLPRDDPRLVRVEAESSRWRWTFRQPGREGAPIVTQDVLHIPAGRPVDVVLTTRDVIHSFWVPRLAGKLDAIPGHRNVLRIEAAEPGTYYGVCAEYCGIGHAQHRFRVRALDDAGWARFQAGEGI